MKTHDDLRAAWNSFFGERGHTAHPSASLVPEDDPTLLFTGAGMNQFKASFVGKGNLPYDKATTIQRCFRQGDLDNVGRTLRHLTLFEMMGHFSFGAYFKEEAIAWAWEFLTQVVGIAPERLHATVYEDDDEAHTVWLKLGLPRERLHRFDAAENFWPADAPRKGPNGVCGPCSEIFFDYGPHAEVGDGGEGALDSGRYVEIWNTVFTQFNRTGPERLEPLPQRNIDCGAGLERVLAAAEDEQSPFQTSLFRPLVSAVADLAGMDYVFDPKGGQAPGEDARRVRRIAEHARAACFLIADGVKPSNESRGYVLRRVLRRAIRDGIQLGLEEPFLEQLVAPVLGIMGGAYPILREGEAALGATLRGEDLRFRETYRSGLRYLEDEIKKLGGAKVMPGAQAFRLYDTYGFPLDLAALILEERGIGVDQAGFDKEMEAQRERARAGSKIKGDIFAGGPLTELRGRKVPETRFIGYGHPGTAGSATVVGLIQGEGLVETLEAGKEGVVVLDQTPFYAEAGGQVGDRGALRLGELTFQVTDTQGQSGYTLHRGTLDAGAIQIGDVVEAAVDAEARAATRRNHTATHLLHAALQQVLGEHVRQEGSLVDPERLRFDISHPTGLENSEIEAIETLVDQWILANDPVQTDEMDIASAKASGAMALFGEKYDDEVRVVHVASGSRELCGGTHCQRTGDIGAFRIVMEASIAAGVRRIEAVTGEAASADGRNNRRIVRELSIRLKTKPDEVIERVTALQNELRNLRKSMEQAAKAAGAQAAKQLIDGAREMGGLRVQLASVPGVDAKSLKGVWGTLQKGGIDVAALIGEQGDKAPLLVALSKQAVARDLDAGALLRVATTCLGGGGGGRGPMAQGQGADRSKIEDALAALQAHLEGALGD